MKVLVAFLFSVALGAAQVTIPDGTKVCVRLDQTISSSTAERGQAVELSVTEPVKAADRIVILQGAHVTGTITQAQDRRSFGHPGKLEISIDRVRLADGEWVPLRYTVNKKSGGAPVATTRVLTASAAVLLRPAAEAIQMIKGKEITLNKGTVFETFTDQDHILEPITAAKALRAAPAAPVVPTSAVNITSNVIGAAIEVDGHYVGSTPVMLPLTSGRHTILVTSGRAVWQRKLQITTEGTIEVNAQLEQMQTSSRR